jgi:hypothetical protein
MIFRGIKGKAIRGLDRPSVFQEVEASRFKDNF